jgi:hypothetical protein
MARELAKKHPCEIREPLHPWKATHLYIGDNGQVLCGRCMGVESTFRPWCWSDLGPMAPDRSITLGPTEVERGPGNFVIAGASVWRCETDPESFLQRERE